MELTFIILLTIFFLVAITMLILLFGDPRNIFSSTEPILTTTIISSTAIEKETKDLSYPRMPSPPPHLIQGLPRAPSLNTPYPKNPPPLGFEFVSSIPEVSQLEGYGPLPYPMGEIPEMPQPLDTSVPYYIPNNEWSHIEEQIVREVASEPEPHEHPPSYEDATNVNEERRLRNRFRH